MKHGITTVEKPTALVVPVASESAIQVAVGIAPVNLATSPSVNAPVLATSFAEAVTKLGWSEDFKNYTLCQVMSASFKIFGVKPVVFINVLDPAVHKKEVPETAMTVQSKQVVISAEVASEHEPVGGILIDTVAVKGADGATAYKLGEDYVTAFDDHGFVVVSIVTGGAIPDATTLLKIGYTKLDPSAVTETDIIGGYTAATGAYKGIESIAQVYPRLNVVPNILTAPGWSHNPNVAMALLGKCEKLNGLFNCLAYVDIASGDDAAPTYDQVKVWKDKNSYTNKWMYPLWPKVLIGKQVYYMSALAAALTANVDTSNSGVPALSPSNKGLRITGLVNEAGSEVNLDMEQANFVNGCGVATAVNMGGWKLWGNNTAAYPENTDPKDFWLNFRRLFAWDSNSTVLSFASSVDQPISQRLIQATVDTKNLQGNGYVAAGNLAAYRCEYIAEENPITSLIGGNIQFRLSLSPYPPAQSIVFTQEFDPAALEAALAGGGS